MPPWSWPACTCNVVRSNKHAGVFLCYLDDKEVLFNKLVNSLWGIFFLFENNTNQGNHLDLSSPPIGIAAPGKQVQELTLIFSRNCHMIWRKHKKSFLKAPRTLQLKLQRKQFSSIHTTIFWATATIFPTVLYMDSDFNHDVLKSRFFTENLRLKSLWCLRVLTHRNGLSWAGFSPVLAICERFLSPKCEHCGDPPMLRIPSPLQDQEDSNTHSYWDNCCYQHCKK